ncbi:ATP-dependent DNA helicase pif1 [Eumeta japonica]|uniref:ATP-dependent DNA helicase n=1 Tax=Eumeta variegata TaxID=151549 RepID=A0A4C1VSS4_EUMVA|nr:ATP-dependent DNA helicase pif1 [Eumeta japonica]
MTAPNREIHDLFDLELQREQEFNSNDLRLFVQSNITKLNIQQKHVYDTIMQAVSNNAGGLYFLDAPGGTGKTFVVSLILATIRSEQKIALALACSGIAPTLLEGGRTAHSALKLPLNVQVIETPICNISRNSAMAKFLRLTSIILWDECTMANKKSLEAFNRTMQDLHGNQQLFDGSLILLSGNFRQTLPVIPRSTPADEINTCLKSSLLWRCVRKLTLNTNMRIHLHNDATAHEFSKQLLEIGDGKIQIDSTNGLITVPNNFCTIAQSIDELIEYVFPNILQNYRNHDWLRERAILAPKNIHINAINFQFQAKLPGVVTTYKSIDSFMNQDKAMNYPIEFLNSLEPAGIPPHCLNLKVGFLIILLRNINPPKLCNGTRLAVKKLLPNLIEATILAGKSKGEVCLIPRIPMIPTDMPFEFKLLQYPVRLSFAMSINEVQGQTLHVCGVNLEESCFSHGQLYVACSRVGTPNCLFIHAQNGKTKNIVYPNVLD